MDELTALQQQIAELQEKASKLLTEKRATALEDVRAKIRTFNLTAKELGFSDKAAPKAASAVPIKYRLGDFVWSGRGRQPKFVVDHLANGGTLEELHV